MAIPSVPDAVPDHVALQPLGLIQSQSNKAVSAAMVSQVSARAAHHQRPQRLSLLKSRLKGCIAVSSASCKEALMELSAVSDSAFNLSPSCLSSLVVRRSISADCVASLSCSRSVKLCVIAPALLVKAALHAEALAALRVGHRQVILALARDAQARPLQRLDEACPVGHLASRHQRRDIGMHPLAARPERQALMGARPRWHPVQLTGALGVVGPRPAMLEVERVP